LLRCLLEIMLFLRGKPKVGFLEFRLVGFLMNLNKLIVLSKEGASELRNLQSKGVRA